MAFQVRVTEIANDDLAALVRFIARDNPPAAERFGRALIEKLRPLQEQPLMGRVVPERADPNLREIIHRPYRIVYRVSEQHQTVEVLRFWHGAHGEPELGK
jgi:plasmid stabilization system protein ParE